MLNSYLFSLLFVKLFMKKCVLLLICVINVALSIHAQSFSTSMIEKKTDCDTMNGAAKVIPSSSTGSYTYLWSTGSTVDSIYGLSPGTYYVTVSHYTSGGAFIDAVQDTAIITFQGVSITLASIIQPTCGANNGSILVSITGGSGSYTLYAVRGGVNYGGGFSLSAGIYQIVAYDNNTGCNSDSFTVILRDTGSYLNLADTIIRDVTCFGDTNGMVQLDVRGGIRPYRYSWSYRGETDSIIENLASGVYTVTITDSLCPTVNRTFSFRVNGPSDSLQLSETHIDDTCLRKTGKINLHAIGGTSPYTYYWNDGSIFSGSADTLISGSYTFTVSDNNGCKDSIQINLANVGGPSAIVLRMDSTCLNDSNGAIRIKVTSRDRPHSFQWSHDSALDSNYVTHLSSGVYTVTITNVNECDTIMHFTIADYYYPSLDVENDTSIIQGQYATLVADIDNDYIDSSYWTPSLNTVSLDRSISVRPFETTTYVYHVRLNSGCYISDSATVIVDSVPVIIEIPNIFTPNNDGVNDFYKIHVNEAVRAIEFHVYDRWGNSIYDAYDLNFQWDGTYMNNEKKCDNGVYTYFLYIDTFVGNKRELKEGNITIVR